MPTEDFAGLVDLGAVVLVIPGHVQGVFAGESPLRSVAEQPRAIGWRDIACDDEHVGLGHKRRDVVSVLEVQIGDDLEQHGPGHR